MRFYNADGFEIMTLKSDDVSTRKTVGFTQSWKTTAAHARSPLASSRSRTFRWARIASSGAA